MPDPVRLEDHSKKAFEDTVKTILTTFGVFTGFAIKSAIDGINFPNSASWWAFLDVVADFHLFVCIATVALLLRFIVGSAVHLNHGYAVEPRSVKPVMLFKDLAFLIVFGLLAIFMIKASDPALKPYNVIGFATRASLFVAVGLLWSLVDALVRAGQTSDGEKTLFSLPWIGIDVGQLIWIQIILYLTDDSWRQSFWLAVGFVVALYLDMKVVLAAKSLLLTRCRRSAAVALGVTSRYMLPHPDHHPTVNSPEHGRLAVARQISCALKSNA